MELVVKKFEQLSLTELYDILNVRAAVFVVEQNCFYNDVDGKDLGAYHLYIKKDDTIIAYLRVLDRGVSFADASSIGRVLTTTRGAGYGKLLMQEAIRVAKEKFGSNRIRIEAQVHAKVFYEKLGFVICSDEFLEDGIPHVEMVYEI